MADPITQVVQSLGLVTAYGYAKSKGYTGTDEEFAEAAAAIGQGAATAAAAAEAASEDAETATTAAGTATTKAAAAASSATEAGEYKDIAENAAADATTSKNAAAGSATSAAASAQAAATSEYNAGVAAGASSDYALDSQDHAEDSEAWAVGTKNGNPVPSTADQYHNNAKYYADLAETQVGDASASASAAAASATAAAASAVSAEAWATGGSGGTAGATNNAEYWAAQAAAQAEAAAGSAASGIAALANEAPVFDASAAYTAGNYVLYDSVLYQFTSDHAAGAWTGTDVRAEKITTLISEIGEYVPATAVTPDLSVTSDGVTVQRAGENTIKIYGTATAIRQFGFLNGQDFVKVSSSPFSKTVDAGKYYIDVTVTGYSSNYIIRGTYTTFSNFFVVTSSTNPYKRLWVSQDTMLAFTTTIGTNYGTADNPTYLTFALNKHTAKDIVAREDASTFDSRLSVVEETSENAVSFEAQSLTESQSTQARKNIDSVGNDTLYKYNAYDAFLLATNEAASSSRNGVTYTKNNDGTWTVNGTATALSFGKVIDSIHAVPRYIVPGRPYRFSFNGGTVTVQIFIYKNGNDDYSYYNTYNDDFEYVFPGDMTGLLLRFLAPTGTSIDNQTLHYTFVPFVEGKTIINNSYTYNTDVSKTVQQITNNYDLDVSPAITTDTNGWLQAVDTDTSSEADKTDMTGAIMAMLSSTGYCHLGEGIFYVSGNIDMPSGSTLVGCGKKSELRFLQSTTAGYCVKISSLNTGKDLCISGAYSAPSVSSQGTRTGVLFAANYDGQEGETQYETDRCLMDNVWVEKFTDSGIKCHNTSISFRKGLYATNVMLSSCWCGLNIDYYSEFNKFTNVLTSLCRIGCINNGGNNVFTACTFHGSAIGFKIDGTQPNSAHGTINGCTFCHAGSNAGSAITIENVSAGFVIDSCQIWYNSIDISNSSGIVFTGCEFGRGTGGNGATINIDGGNLVLFNGCVFMNDVTYPPEVTVNNNSKVEFTSCFGSQSGNSIVFP